MRQIPSYQANSHKALEVIVWLCNEKPGLDVYHLVKAAFFADKAHVIGFGRPICGDTYNAAPYGPLAQVIYGLLRRDHIEMLALGGNGEMPFDVDEKHRVTAYRPANARRLSKSEISCLREGLSHVSGKSFDDLFQETHDDPAYINASGGKIDYRDFLPSDASEREGKAQDLLETSAILVC